MGVFDMEGTGEAGVGGSLGVVIVSAPGFGRSEYRTEPSGSTDLNTSAEAEKPITSPRMANDHRDMKGDYLSWKQKTSRIAQGR